MDKYKKFIKILLVIEIVITFSVIITYGLYDIFWQINGYAFPWFWIKGVLGIALFVFELGKKNIHFKKNYIRLLIIPMIFSILGFIGVVYGVIHPWNIHYYLMDAFKQSLLVFGFPLWIILILQDRFEINRTVIGISSILTPIASLTVSFNIMIR